MIQRLIVGAALGLALCGPAAAGESSSQGQLLCHQDVAKTAHYADQKSTSLTPAQRRTVAERLHVADQQCRSRPSLATTTLDLLRRDLARDQVQSAQTPEGSADYGANWQ